MYRPKIESPIGTFYVTDFSDNDLREAYMNSDASPEDKGMVILIRTGSTKRDNKFLRMALQEGADLVAVYPGLKEKAPKGAIRICEIMDGELYLVKTIPNAVLELAQKEGYSNVEFLGLIDSDEYYLIPLVLEPDANGMLPPTDPPQVIKLSKEGKAELIVGPKVFDIFSALDE
jgi:hypothetical protein